MAKQISNVQKIGMENRDRLFPLNKDYSKDNQYSEQHKNAISDGDVKGKGTESSYTHTLPSAPDKMAGIKHQLDTENGGGKYDIDGYNEIGGRKYLEGINVFNKDEKNYSKNESLYKKQSRNGNPTTEYVIPDLNNGVKTNITINTTDGGNDIDREARTRAIGINKYSENNKYLDTIIHPDIEGEVGW